MKRKSMDLRINMEVKGKRIGLDEYNHQIDVANERIKNDEFYTQEEVEKMPEKW